MKQPWSFDQEIALLRGPSQASIWSDDQGRGWRRAHPLESHRKTRYRKPDLFRGSVSVCANGLTHTGHLGSAEPIKFLLVDDTHENIVAIEALLRRDGLEILTARSGVEALELLLTHEVALTLIDVQMPGMGGFELASLMRGSSRTRDVPIIFITAGGPDQPLISRAYQAGAVDVLFKPVEPVILQSKADVFFVLARQRQEAAETLRLTEMFVGVLGHDLRAPISALIAGVDVLTHDLVDPSHGRIVARMNAAAQRMSDMVEQLLDLTRARLAGGLGFAGTRTGVMVGSLVDTLVDEIRATTSDREIVVEKHRDGEVTGNRSRLMQLFANLLTNAIRHGDRGTPIRVMVGDDERGMTIAVHNRGTIPATLLPRIFEPFRGRSVEGPRSSGLGLGLFIAKEIAIAHGAALEVESSQESGTTFTVRFPPHATTPTHAREPKHVLVVEDEEGVRNTLDDVCGSPGIA